MSKRVMALLLALLFAVTPGALAKGKSKKAKAVKKVNIVEESLAMKIGETQQLTLLFKPDGSSAKIQWASSQKNVATVENGLVTAVSAGTATVSVTTKNGKKDACRVTVTDPDKVVALTFDDGPCKNTLEILRLLKQYNAKATFFMLGEMVLKNGTVAKAVADSGSEVACHGTTHKNFQKMTVDEVKAEISEAVSSIEGVSGVTPKLIRAPYGAIDVELAKKAGYPFIQWSIDPEDWKDRDGKTVYQRIADNVKPGSIVLMHDLYSSTTDAVRLLLPELQRQGYTFLTVSELMAFRGVEDPVGQVIY